jgi:type I restriction enzyme S subunit
MEVKKGYKQTEVGVIPVDWKVRPIREISNPVRGGSPRPAGDPRFFDGKFIPWLTVAALTNIPSSQLKVSHTDSCLTEEGSLRSRILYPGTLILANSGATLGVAKILGIKCCANDGIAALLNFNATVSKTYLVHYINTRTQYLRDVVATGNGQPNLNTDLIGNFKIPLPPTLAEQEAIAGALSDADAWIESLEQLIAKKRQIKQGAMQELLTGKRRLPGFSGEWETKRLGEFLVSHPQYGINAAAVPYSDKLPVYIRITDITEYGQYAPNPRVCVQVSAVSGYFLADGDLVVARTGASVGKSYRYRIADGPLVFAGFLIRIRPNAQQLNPRFLEGYVAGEKYWNWVRLMSMRSGQPGINGNEYAQLPIELPSIAEQTAIATVLSDMDTEIESLESKLAKASEIKQGMMQELLTGKIRLV